MIKFNPITLDAEMVLGNTGSFPITPTINGKKFLKIGDEIWFTLRKRKENTVLLQKVVNEFEDGTATVPINPNDTINMDPGTYIYDLVLIRSDGNTDSLLPQGDQAYFVLKKGVK